MKTFDNLFPKRLSKRAQKRTPMADRESKSKVEDSLNSGLILRINGDFWIDIAGAVWKLRQIVKDPITHETRDEMRSLTRHVDAIWDALATVGVDIQDHTSLPFDSGQSLEVLAFQPTAGVTREIVIETVKPSIYLKGNRLQMGQVIVATPEK